MTDDKEELGITSEELSEEEKIEKLEMICAQTDVDVEEILGDDMENVGVEGTLTVRVEGEDGELKDEQEIDI